MAKENQSRQTELRPKGIEERKKEDPQALEKCLPEDPRVQEFGKVTQHPGAWRNKSLFLFPSDHKRA